MRLRLVPVVIASAAAVLAVAPFASASAAASRPPSAAKHGDYQFASNNGVTWRIGAGPVITPQATQAFTPSGVTVSIRPSASAGYADSGIIVNLGRLSALFNASGEYVAPQIDVVATPGAASPVGVNYYFGTNGDTSGFLAFDSAGVYEGNADGDNLASASVSGGDSVDFGTFAGTADQNTTVGLSGTMTMEQVLAAFQARTDGGTTNPEVWAWIGVSGSTSQKAIVASVDGRSLVTVATQLDATLSCFSGLRQRWVISEAAGDRKVAFTYSIRRDYRWIREGRKTLAAGGAATVTTRRGGEFKAVYRDGIGRTVTSYSGTRNCVRAG